MLWIIMGDESIGTEWDVSENNLRHTHISGSEMGGESYLERL